MRNIFGSIMYSFTFVTLFTIDYLLGNGFVELFQRILCKMLCFIRKSLREEEKLYQMGEGATISLKVLVCEIALLGFTITFLNKYKKIRCKDKIDDLLQESREALRQTNEFLDKWRLRRMNMQSPEEYSYLDEEPQQIMPYKLEVPILHMAIIDALGTRNQPESGDTGDVTSCTDSALISLTSLLDDDFVSTTDELADERFEETNSTRNRVLWDATEEGSNLDE
ncbi:uncharacterized protein LOC120633846 [Pararge aegeria]|uniref:uncharacterized protein LOC120633846 n=1 Tax=Pararge aegeria TaxID=116150 RepID=UPI0019D042AE|nr:uncharacterized protein LOC120633846 [Pararge aegeria]